MPLLLEMLVKMNLMTIIQFQNKRKIEKIYIFMSIATIN